MVENEDKRGKVPDNIMDEFFEYWELIHEKEKYEKAGKEIVKYKRNISDVDISSRDLPKCVFEFFEHHLIHQPYPTWEILYHIIDIGKPEKNRLLEELVVNVLSTLINIIIEHPDEVDKHDKLYNLLSNIYVSEWCINQIRDLIIPRLFDLKENRGILNNVLYLALLSRPVHILLTHYMDYERRQTIEKCCIKSLFLSTCYEKIHWIDALLDIENDKMISSSLDHKVYQHLKLFRLIFTIDEKFGGSSWFSQLEEVQEKTILPGSALELCHAEMTRQKNIFEFLRSYQKSNNTNDGDGDDYENKDDSDDDKLFTNNLIMKHLLSHHIYFSVENYKVLKKLLESNHKLTKHQFIITGIRSILINRSEYDVFNEYMIIKLYLNLIQSNDLTQEVIDSHLNDIRSLLRTINDGKILFQLMQNVFTLIFLRFEHVRKTKRKSKNSELNSDSVSNNINSQTTDVSDTTAAEMQLQNGFVCLKLSLSAILNSMRMFLMGLDKMEVYQTCSDQLKKKFAAMLVDVDNALWRLRLIDRVGKRMGKSYPKIKEWLRFYDEKVVNNNNSLDITSDDEKSPKKKMKSQRRKLKKRPKITIVTDENDEASDDPVEYQLTTSEVSKTENSEIRSRFSDLHRKVRSIISKMLMSPESLLSICVLENDHENVQEIIQSYNLTDSEICHEINFMRNFNECKANLHEIVTRYKEFLQRQEKNTEKLTKVEEIRQIAESGFEKAKFLNSMEKFTTNNHLMYSENDEKLLEKVSTQHPCLKVYQSYRINVLPLIDFMISLPCPFELNYNIFKHIMKQWNLEQFKDDNFGFNKFLKNLMDILTIYRNHNIDKTIEELFNDEVFTLSSPTKLKKQLKNRKNVLKFMEMNVERLNNEADIVNVSEKFKNFDCDVDFIGRIASYVRNVKDLMKLQTNKLFTFNELMFLNLDEVVGKLVFNQQCSPEQVENFAYNVNINLVHSMAVTAVGEFQSPIDDGELLYSFLLNETDSSNFIEVAEMSNQSYYDLNNLDILYYIKKEGSFMVAYLMKMIKNVDYKTLRYDEKNFFERLAKIENAEMLKSLFGNSKIVTALNSDHIKLKLLMTKIQKTKDLNEKLKILCSISERQWNRCFVEFNKLKDFYIEMIILNSSNESKREKFKKLEEIESVKKFSEILLKCIGDIDSDEYAEKLLRRSLNPKNSSVLDDSTITELRRWMKKLKIYRKISKIFEEYEPESEVCWSKVKQTADEKPEILINYLLNVNINLSACLEFLHIHPLRYQNDDITKMWVETLNNRKLTDQHETLFKIIETFPKKQVIDFFYFSLNFINHLPSMVRIINFLQSSIDDEVSLINQIRFQKFTISTRIIECLGDNKNGLWRLASRPLIILEQFLMNSKIEALRKVIRELRKLLQNQPSCETCELTSRNMYQVGESLVYDFNAYHDEIFISNECIDLLLKLYTAKALDFQIVDVHSVPPSTEVSSVDSSFGMFQMPKNIPSRDQWIQDSVTSHCMCCKRQKFSLLTRRHHCRRCGRVVCANCSQNRLQFPEVYNELMVRVCIECYQQIDIEKKKKRIEVDLSSADGKIEWKLTGDISADQLIRDDFNFEFSPNVGLCISIINLHSSNDELAQFLLFHCHRLEILLRPIHGGKVNEEIDMSLVAKMLKCLAFAAKIRGAYGEANMIIDHADVVMKMAENNCESIVPLIPMEPINSVTIRNIINDLIKAENWKIALELSVKWDRSGTPGVFSAWGVSAIKAGRYRFAREKITLALQSVNGSSTQINNLFIKMLNDNNDVDPTWFNYKRSTRSPPLLQEVLESLETNASRQPKSEVPSNVTVESPTNVLNLLSNLKNISEGDYGPATKKPLGKFEWQSNSSPILSSHYYEESVYYLTNYGGNAEYISFLMVSNLISSTLRYVIAQQIPTEVFIHHVFVPIAKTGRLSEFIDLVKQMDGSFKIWEDYIIAACKYLERKRALHCLYQMQILIGDFVRAALTCIKFYLDGSGNYTELHSKCRYLVDAKSHLQTELEKTSDWNKKNNQKSESKKEIALKWDLKKINAHINIISLQIEVSKYLARCEADGLPTIGLMPRIFLDKPGMKTLFGLIQERNHVAILLLLCGHSIENGFGLSYRVIQECSLSATKIYSTCIKYLAKNVSRLLDVEKFIESIKTNAANEENVIDIETLDLCDELVAMAVEIAYNQHQANAKNQIDKLIKLITSKSIKIQCYINSNQLKTAYMLSASLNNYDDIKKILKHAEASRQENVRRLCEKKLFQTSGNENGSSQGSKSDINQL